MKTLELTEDQCNGHAFSLLRQLDGLTVQQINEVLERTKTFARNTAVVDCRASEYQRCEQGFAPAVHQAHS
jgi:hypothetical protein